MTVHWSGNWSSLKIPFNLRKPYHCTLKGYFMKTSVRKLVPSTFLVDLFGELIMYVVEYKWKVALFQKLILHVV